MPYSICLFLSDLLSMILSRSIHLAQMALFYKSRAHEQCAGDLGSIPGSERSPGGGNEYPLQYSCLENSIDRGAWRATVHGVAKIWT